MYAEPLKGVFLGVVGDMPNPAAVPSGCLYIVPAIVNPATPASLWMVVAGGWTKIF